MLDVEKLKEALRTSRADRSITLDDVGRPTTSETQVLVGRGAEVDAVNSPCFSRFMELFADVSPSPAIADDRVETYTIDDIDILPRGDGETLQVSRASLARDTAKFRDFAVSFNVTRLVNLYRPADLYPILARAVMMYAEGFFRRELLRDFYASTVTTVSGTLSLASLDDKGIYDAICDKFYTYAEGNGYVASYDTNAHLIPSSFPSSYNRLSLFRGEDAVKAGSMSVLPRSLLLPVGSSSGCYMGFKGAFKSFYAKVMKDHVKLWDDGTGGVIVSTYWQYASRIDADQFLFTALS